MLISDRHRFIFVHVPRTGGTSVKNALSGVSLKRNYAHWEKWLTRIGLIRDYHHFRFRTHCSLMDIQRHVPQGIFDDYFKFVIVRHPWSRLKSEYRFLLCGSDLHDNRGRSRHRWFNQICSFEDFIVQRVNHPNALQFDMIKAPTGGLGVDFVGKTEQLEQDFELICGTIKVQARLPRFNEARKDPVGTALEIDTDSTEVRNLFLEHWQADLETFGYREPFPK